MEGRPSFLTKRSKNLLPNAANIRCKTANQAPPASDKSFLVLFFKKELLPVFLMHSSP
jgi:hypothetical protein